MNNFLSVIGKVAPFLAETFGGPVGALVGMGISAVTSAVSPDAATQITAAQTSGGTQGALQKIEDLFTQGVISTNDFKKAELAHAEKMAELGYKNVADIAAINAGDRDSARKREEVVKDNTPAFLAWLIVLATVICGVVIIGDLTPATKDPTQSVMVGTVIGYLFSEAKQVLAYYFGSSVGSKDKDATLSEIAKQP